MTGRKYWPNFLAPVPEPKSSISLSRRSGGFSISVRLCTRQVSHYTRRKENSKTCLILGSLKSGKLVTESTTRSIPILPCSNLFARSAKRHARKGKGVSEVLGSLLV